MFSKARHSPLIFAPCPLDAHWVSLTRLHPNVACESRVPKSRVGMTLPSWCTNNRHPGWTSVCSQDLAKFPYLQSLVTGTSGGSESSRWTVQTFSGRDDMEGEWWKISDSAHHRSHFKFRATDLLKTSILCLGPPCRTLSMLTTQMTQRWPLTIILTLMEIGRHQAWTSILYPPIRRVDSPVQLLHNISNKIIIKISCLVQAPRTFDGAILIYRNLPHKHRDSDKQNTPIRSISHPEKKPGNTI